MESYNWLSLNQKLGLLFQALHAIHCLPNSIQSVLCAIENCVGIPHLWAYLFIFIRVCPKQSKKKKTIQNIFWRKKNFLVKKTPKTQTNNPTMYLSLRNNIAINSGWDRESQSYFSVCRNNLRMQVVKEKCGHQDGFSTQSCHFQIFSQLINKN